MRNEKWFVIGSVVFLTLSEARSEEIHESRVLKPGLEHPVALQQETPVAPQLPRGSTENFTNFSRGNDDPRERDGAGVGIYETALIRLSLYTVPKQPRGFTLGIRYAATLQTSEEQAPRIGQNFYLDCRRAQLDAFTEPAASQLQLQRPANGGARGSILSTQIELGDMIQQNGNYSGQCEIIFRNGSVKQRISWTASVRNNIVESTSTTLSERTAAGQEMIVPFESNHNPSPRFSQRHPPKRGESTGERTIN